jgi:DnaJ family protein A protein 5
MREAKLNEHVQPAWAQTSHTEEEGIFSDSELSDEEVVECVTCNKIFKSEKQYEAHEKSKKHIKAVQQLTRQMRKENQLLHLDTPNLNDAGELQYKTGNSNSEASSPTVQYSTDGLTSGITQTNPELGSISISDGSDDFPTEVKSLHADHPANKNEITSGVIAESAPHETTQNNTDDDDDYAPREQVEVRISGLSNPDQKPSKADGSTKSDGIHSATMSFGGISISNDKGIAGVPTEETKKLGKAKAKRAKKAERQQMENDTQSVRIKFHTIIANANIITSSHVLPVTPPLVPKLSSLTT